MYLILAALDLHCCAWALLVAERGAAFRCGAWTSHCGGFLHCRARAFGTRASGVAAPGLWSTCSVVVALGLSYSTAREVFPD